MQAGGGGGEGGRGVGGEGRFFVLSLCSRRFVYIKWRSLNISFPYVLYLLLVGDELRTSPGKVTGLAMACIIVHNIY